MSRRSAAMAMASALARALRTGTSRTSISGACACVPAVRLFSGREGRERRREEKDGQGDALAEAQAKADAITDKIPERPVSVVEGTSYSIVILAALGVAGAAAWAVIKELVLEPKEYKVFHVALERIRSDPRVTVRLGSPLSGYGADVQNRAARQRIRHRIYDAADGHEHVQVQFQVRGPTGTATVHADAYKQDGNYEYSYLYVDVGSPYPKRIVVVGQDRSKEY